MDSSLNHFKGSQNRRGQRKDKKNRKYTSAAANEIKAEYKSQLSKSSFSEEDKLALRNKLLEQRLKKRKSNLILLVILAFLVTMAFVLILNSDLSEFYFF